MLESRSAGGEGARQVYVWERRDQRKPPVQRPCACLASPRSGPEAVVAEAEQAREGGTYQAEGSALQAVQGGGLWFCSE